MYIWNWLTFGIILLKPPLLSDLGKQKACYNTAHFTDIKLEFVSCWESPSTHTLLRRAPIWDLTKSLQLWQRGSYLKLGMKGGGQYASLHRMLGFIWCFVLDLFFFFFRGSFEFLKTALKPAAHACLDKYIATKKTKSWTSLSWIITCGKMFKALKRWSYVWPSEFGQLGGYVGVQTVINRFLQPFSELL